MNTQPGATLYHARIVKEDVVRHAQDSLNILSGMKKSERRGVGIEVCRRTIENQPKAVILSRD